MTTTKQTNSVYTSAGDLKKVNLEEFMTEVPVERVGELIAMYNSCVSYGDHDNSNVPAGELPHQEDSMYTRTCVVLAENSAHNQLLQLLEQVKFIPVRGATFQDKVEDAAVYCLENFGTPTHLVEITWNCHAIFCVNDFKYKFMDPTKGALVCYYPTRNVIFKTNDF